MEKQAVLLMSYGTPNRTEEIWDYYTHIRHGKEPSQALYDELVGRYEEIGGVSPLAHITEAQRAAIEEKLNESGTKFCSHCGNNLQYSHSVKDGLPSDDLKQAKIDEHERKTLPIILAIIIIVLLLMCILPQVFIIV